MNCQDLIERIKRGGKERESATEELYKKYFGFVIRFSKQFSMLREDVLSIYNEAIAELVYRIDRGSFDSKNPGACSSFIFQVCFNQCANFTKKDKSFFKIPDDDNINSIPDPNDPIENSEVWEDDDLRYCLQKLTPKCQRILSLWADGYSMKEIVEKMDTINSVNSASVTKFGCLEKLQKCMKQRREQRGRNQ